MLAIFICMVIGYTLFGIGVATQAQQPHNTDALTFVFWCFCWPCRIGYLLAEFLSRNV